MLLNFFYLNFALYFILFFFSRGGFKKTEITICICTLLVNLSTLILIYRSSSNFPVYNIFESFLFVSLILCTVGLLVLFRGYHTEKVRKWVWIEIIILFVIMHFFPKEASVRIYDHGYLYVVMFHVFRYIALALMLLATAWFIQFIIQREMDERTSLLAHNGRNYLLLAAVFYLMGEYVGIIWCQKGWGDFWMWSKTFLQSTFVVLYLMLAFHIPGKGRKAEDIRCIIGGLSGLFFLTLSVMRSMF